jgi:hypothetical protein
MSYAGHSDLGLRAAGTSMPCRHGGGGNGTSASAARAATPAKWKKTSGFPTRKGFMSGRVFLPPVLAAEQHTGSEHRVRIVPMPDPRTGYELPSPSAVMVSGHNILPTSKMLYVPVKFGVQSNSAPGTYRTAWAADITETELFVPRRNYSLEQYQSAMFLYGMFLYGSDKQ